MVAMGFQPGSLALSASIIREDKEAAFCPLAAIEEQRPTHKAKQKTLMSVLECMLGYRNQLYIAAQLLVRLNGSWPATVR